MRGLSSETMVLSDRLGKDEHLRRMHLADLFVDNHHVNAHTTASEALWSGNVFLHAYSVCANETSVNSIVA